MIYFIHKPNERSMKVGLSDDPMRRLATLQTGSPSPLSMYAIIPGLKAAEAYIHRDLHPHRIRGEWFHDVPVTRYLHDHFRSELVAWFTYPDPDGKTRWFYRKTCNLRREEAVAFLVQRFDEFQGRPALLKSLGRSFGRKFQGFEKDVGEIDIFAGMFLAMSSLEEFLNEAPGPAAS